MCCSPRVHKESDMTGQLNNTNINTGVHVSFQIGVLFFFSDLYQEMELLGHIVILFKVF